MKDVCPECNGNISYRSEPHLIPQTDPQTAGLEGVCDDCGSVWYAIFEATKVKVTIEDWEIGEELSQRIIYV